MSAIKSSDFEWEMYDGDTQGIYGNLEWEITISARPTAKDVRWGAEDSNIRSWAVIDGSGTTVASGQADGVRACKSAAIAAINA